LQKWTIFLDQMQKATLLFPVYLGKISQYILAKMCSISRQRCIFSPVIVYNTMANNYGQVLRPLYVFILYRNKSEFSSISTYDLAVSEQLLGCTRLPAGSSHTSDGSIRTIAGLYPPTRWQLPYIRWQCPYNCWTVPAYPLAVPIH